MEPIISPDLNEIETNCLIFDVGFEDLQLQTLLESWGFGYYFNLLKEQQITIERLKLLTNDDLKELLSQEKLGNRIEFRQKVLEWKIELGITTASTGDTLSVDSNKDVEIHHFRFFQPTPLSTGPATFNLINAIKNSSHGEYIFRIYEKTKKLDDVARKLIIDIIIGWHNEKEIHLTRSMFIKISCEIEKYFNDDKTIYYKKVGNIPSGRLYDKYQNHVRRLRKLGLISSSTLSSPSSTSTLTEENLEELSETEKEDIDNCKLWLQLNKHPWAQVQEKWKKTFKLRRKEILEKERRTEDIFNSWLLLKHSDGHSLIDIDFSELYEGKNYNLLKNWAHFKLKIIEILNAKVKDKQNLDILKLINSSCTEDASLDTSVALVIHAILPPTIKHVLKKENKKVICKSTIKDSQNSFVLHVITINDLERKVEEYRLSLDKRNEKLQPLIVVVGPSLFSLKEFVVIYDDVMYKFDNFLAAFDCCFKVFHILDLRYPTDSYNFWIFVQKYFFDISISTDKISSSVLCLLQETK